MQVPHFSRDPRMAQLGRILDSEKFAGSGRLGRFLRFVVEETLAGRSDQVKEYTIGLEVYDKPSTYDPKVDSTVRVEAGKLRARLTAYYESEGKSDPLVISIPKGAYIPAFETRTVVELPMPEARPSSPSLVPVALPELQRAPTTKWVWIAVAGAALAITGLVVWFRPSEPGAATPASASRLLTHDLGVTIQPALSVEGKLLVYASDRAGQGNLDIWVQPVSGGEPLRITDHPADDSSPIFSPDGSRIVYRSERDGGGLFETSALGGNTRLLAKDGRYPEFSPQGDQLAFQTGNPQLALSGVASGEIWVMPASGGEPRRLRPEFSAAMNPIWTPDGRHILFLGYPAADFSSAKMDWWVTAADGTGQAVSTEFKDALTQQKLCGIFNPWRPRSWMGTHVLFATHCGGGELWRISISQRTWKVDGKAERVTVASSGATDPFAAAGRIVYGEMSRNREIWSLPLDAQGRAAGQPVRITESAATEDHPSVSSDAKVLVFTSTRGGDSDVWTRNLETGKEQVLIAAKGADTYPQVNSDGQTFTWHQVIPDPSDPTGWNHVAWRSTFDGSNRQKLCEHCAYMGVAPDGRRILDLDGNPITISFLDAASRKYAPFVRDPKRDLLLPTPSPDRKWMVFVAKNPSGTRSIYTIPFHEPAPAAEAWSFIGDGVMPAWSVDSRVLYYVAPHESAHCVMARRIGLDGIPEGESFAIAHFHSPRLRIAMGGTVFRWLSAARDRIVLPLDHVSGQIRLLEPESTR